VEAIKIRTGSEWHPIKQSGIPPKSRLIASDGTTVNYSELKEIVHFIPGLLIGPERFFYLAASLLNFKANP
jgi:hypothetical protein